MLIQAEKSISARMDQWAGNLSKVALQSRLCVKSRVLPYSDMALDWLVKPTTGQVMCHQRGHFEWQTIPSAPFRGVMQKPPTSDNGQKCALSNLTIYSSCGLEAAIILLHLQTPFERPAYALQSSFSQGRSALHS